MLAARWTALGVLVGGGAVVTGILAALGTALSLALAGDIEPDEDDELGDAFPTPEHHRLIQEA